MALAMEIFSEIAQGLCNCKL